MNKIPVLAIILLVVSVGFLGGCTETKNLLQSNNSEFVGTWVEDGDFGAGPSPYLEFFSDNTGVISYQSMTWEIKDGRLVINRIDGIAFSYSYEFSENDNKLTLIMPGSNPDTYTKQ